MNWYLYALTKEEEGLYIIYCENCEKIFSIKSTTWKKLEAFHLKNLESLDSKAHCCKNPYWLFITDMYSPKRKLCKKEKPKYFLSILKNKWKEYFLWVELLGRK